MLGALYNRIGHVSPHYHRISRLPNQNFELLCSREQCDFPRLGLIAWLSKGIKGMRNPESFLVLRKYHSHSLLDEGAKGW